MTTRAASGRRYVLLAALVALGAPVGALVGPSPSRAQDEDPAAVAARVHTEGGYPDDISVLDEPGTPGELHGNGSDGMGQGPHGAVDPNGDRDGGDPDRSLDLQLPQFVRDLLEALGRVIGTAARPLTYLLFALGIALIVAFVVYLVTLFRFPRRDLTAVRREHGGDGAMALDPLLEEALSSPEEYARQGKFREAIHALFVRSLGEVARQGDVDRRGRTAREVVSAIAKIQTAPPALADLLALTELVWFGGRPATERQYVHAIDLAARIRAAAPSPLAAPHGAPRAEAP